MEKKYYTPEIEELITFIMTEGCVYTIYKDKPDDIVKLVFRNLSRIHDLYGFIETNNLSENGVRSIDPKLYRLPYLDKEDIEECGWNFQREAQSVVFFENFMNHRGVKTTIIFSYSINALWALISIRPAGALPNDYRTIFAGTIKNKSELKFQMDRLNIKA